MITATASTRGPDQGGDQGLVVHRALSAQCRTEAGTFVEQSVTRWTSRAYESHWSSWVGSMRESMDDENPYLRNWSEGDRPALVCLFLRSRYQDGLRVKQATAVTAGMRLEFSKALLPTGFLDSALLTAARTACRMSTAELRAKKDRGANPDVKTPLCESVLLGTGAGLWKGKGWGRGDTDGRMVYLAGMWGYDQTARVSEYTAPEGIQEDHCIRVSYLTFELRVGQRVVRKERACWGVRWRDAGSWRRRMRRDSERRPSL